MAVPTLKDWQSELLTGIQAPVTPQNLQFVNAWAQAEGGGATNNPFNTTEPVPGASAYNSVGVRNYATPEQGIQATIKTLLGPVGNYAPILSALRSGTSAQAAAQAVANSQWGTGPGVLRVLGASPTVAGGQASGTALPGASSGAALPVSSKLPSMPTLPGYHPIDFTQTVLGSLGKSPLALMNAITKKAISTPLAQITAPDVHTAVAPTGTTIQIQGTPHPQDVKAVQLAEHFIGTPYKWGGTSPSGFDCSGLIQYVWSKLGVQVPRTTYAQWDAGTPVAKDDLKPGDAVYFTGSDPEDGKPGHVGMYIGGGKFIEAPHTGADVRVSTLAGRGDYVGARTFV